MFARVPFTRSSVLLSALASMIAPVAASAEQAPVFIYGEGANVRTERVSYARLDLSLPRDQKRLEHRVGAAVERVCLREIGRGGLQDRGYYTCADLAWQKAAPQIAEAARRSSDLALRESMTAITVSAG